MEKNLKYRKEIKVQKKILKYRKGRKVWKII